MPLKRTVRVGTRASPLSLAQTRQVVSSLQQHFPDTTFLEVPISTGGDRQKDAPLLSLGKGTFVKDIEQALIDGEIDFAVHSAKDLTAELPQGLVLAAVGPRADPRDALVDRWHLPLRSLPSGARLGTSSPRRAAQIAVVRRDVDVLPIRGNVGTRLDKARGEDYDGVVLAAAGIQRLGRQSEIDEFLSPDEFTPEVGQGALALEAREDDTETVNMLATVNDEPSRTAVDAERAFLAEIGGGCRVPVTAYARLDGGRLRISAMAAAPDGRRLFRIEVTGDTGEPEAAGAQAARRLLEAGAREIVAT